MFIADYTRAPGRIRNSIWALGIAGLGVLGIGIYGLAVGHAVIPDPTSLGGQGDFVGGHVAAVVGFVTLAVVLYIGVSQSRQTERFFMRQYFLSGVEQLNIALQANDHSRVARIFDYFSRLALSQDDDELFLILDTTITPALENILTGEGNRLYADGHWFVPQALARIKSIHSATYVGLIGM